MSVLADLVVDLPCHGRQEKMACYLSQLLLELRLAVRVERRSAIQPVLVTSLQADIAKMIQKVCLPWRKEAFFQEPPSDANWIGANLARSADRTYRPEPSNSSNWKPAKVAVIEEEEGKDSDDKEDEEGEEDPTMCPYDPYHEDIMRHIFGLL